ncbi:DUF221-domain-containing protein [Agrocybe pediades]|nr:DUF221-domain-containing protein [Agrocybe pediades]
MSAIDPSKASKSNTTTAFLTALAVNGGLLLLEVGAFIILKRRLWRIYSPRTVLPPPDKRAKELPPGLWRWVPAVITTPVEDIIAKNGLDAYMFLRFIRLLIIIFLLFTWSTFIIIIPANSAYIESNLPGLDRISWSNIVDPKDQIRFCAHIVVVYILTAFVIYMIYHEMLHFVHMRHQFLISKSHSRLPQARTVLITSVPEELANEQDLRLFASFVPGGVDKVWMYRDTSSLNDLFEKREDACAKLEAAEAALLKSATLAWRRKAKEYRKIQSRKLKDEEITQDQYDPKLAMPPASRELLDELVPPDARPHHRTGFLGLVGQKVDTIDWCKARISRLNHEIEEKRRNIVKGKFLGSAFIRCNLQLGAHVLAQCLSYHEPLRMYSKTLEAHPKDIVWRNLDDGALEMKSRYATSWIATAGLIFVWAFPVGFIGALSNLSDLCDNVHWLKWVCRAPPIAQGFIEGVLPPLLLAIMFALLPMILYALAWYECIPRYTLMSIAVYKRFYLFLLIHGFLIVTLTSGITNAVEDIVKNPTQTVQQLSSQLPGASVFFLTYLVTQGLAGAGSALVQLAPLALHYLRKWFLGRTPRQAYAVTFEMPSADFGVVLPRMSLLATITFAYSVLSPLINLLALISYAMFYLAWKFLLTQVFDQPDEKESGGLYFPMAINNLFVGLYIEQICLACLFFLNTKAAGKTAAVQGIFMLVLLVLTACAHTFIQNSFKPLELHLPMSLATKKMAKRYAKQQADEGAEGGEIDLFSRNRIRSVRRRIKTTTKGITAKVTNEFIRSRVGNGAPEGKDDMEMTALTEKANKRESNNSTSTAVSSSHGETKENRDDLSRHSSVKSDKSKSSSKKPTPMFDPAAPAVRNSDSETEDDEDEHAFDHPSTYVDQKWIWLPKDPLGLSEILTRDLKDAGVNASDVGANMDEKGVVEVTRNPPDEDWDGGHDL